MSFEPSQHVGQSVTIHGTASDARAGAVVVLEDGTPIYIAGVESWDPKVEGNPVEASGLLQERPAKAPKAAHGLTGATFVLENATWKLSQ